MPDPHLRPHPPQEDLDEHFTLTSSDLALIAALKKEQNRLGFAVLLKSYAFLGYPPRRKTEVSATMAEWLARQLGLSAETFADYSWRGRVWKCHLSLIRRHVSSRAFGIEVRGDLFEWLVTRGNELFTRKGMVAAAVDWGRSHGLELPVEAELRRLTNPARRRKPSPDTAPQATLSATLLAALPYHRGVEVTNGLVQTSLELLRKIDKKTDTAIEKIMFDDIPRVFGKNRILYEVAKAVVGEPDGLVRGVVISHLDEDVFQRLVEEFEHEAPDYETSCAQVMRKKYAASYRRML